VGYTEKLTWEGRVLVLERPAPPTAAAPQGQGLRLEVLDVRDPALRPSNQDAAEGTPLPVFQAPGVRVDVSKRRRAPMPFWHRNLEHDELIFCHQGAMTWETELGTVTLRAGQMLLIPQGVAHRAVPPEGDGENILIELKLTPTARCLVAPGTAEPA
jgi:quercetin dioxygenase-like cupin family protein